MMSRQARRELVAAVRPRYHKADRSGKRTILDEFTAASGYQGKYPIAVLNELPVAKRESRPRKSRPKTL